MSETHYITKGTRVRAEWFATKPVGLAGAQMKLGAQSKSVVGTVVEVRGDAPNVEDCKEVFFYVQPDTGGDLIEVKHSWIKEVLS